MALVSMKEMLRDAQRRKYAVGAFEFWSLDSAQVIIHAASKFNVPVILQNGDIEKDHAESYYNMRRLAELAAEGANIPIALHLDHASSVEQCREAIDAGYKSVMIDASHEPYEVNVALTREVIAIAHPLGITVEAELGILGGVEGGGDRLSAIALQTKPEEAARFAADTGVDALAVAIGTAHGKYTVKPEINIALLKQIRAATQVPLVLHGGSDTPEDKICKAIAGGIVKVNVCTDFITAFGKKYLEVQAKPNFKYNAPNLFTAAKTAGYELVSEKLSIFTRGIINT